MKRLTILYIVISLLLCSALSACGQKAEPSGIVPEAPESSPGLVPQSVASPDQGPESEASQTPTPSPTPTPTPTPERKPSPTDIALDQLNKEWMLKYNEENMDIMDFYFDNTTFFSDGKIEIVNRDVMGQFIENRYSKNMKLKSIDAIYRDKAYFFTNEIGSIVTESGETLQYLCVWVKKGDTWLRAVEAISEKNTDRDFSSDIDITKEAFVDFLKLSDIEALVDRCVAVDAVNFCNDSNNVFQGKDEFIYDFKKYMNYLPTGFETKIMTSVGENLVFELGRTRNYTLAYAYIWVRGDDGQWKMILFTQ